MQYFRSFSGKKYRNTYIKYTKIYANTATDKKAVKQYF